MLFLYNCLNNVQLHNIFDGVICLFPMHHSTFHVTLPFWCTSTEVPNSACLKVSTVLLCTVIFDIRRQKCLKLNIFLYSDVFVYHLYCFYQLIWPFFCLIIFHRAKWCFCIPLIDIKLLNYFKWLFSEFGNYRNSEIN